MPWIRLIADAILYAVLTFNLITAFRLRRATRKLRESHFKLHNEFINLLDATASRVCPLCSLAVSPQATMISFTPEYGDAVPCNVSPEEDGFHIITGLRTPDGHQGPQRLSCPAAYVRGFSKQLVSDLLEEQYGVNHHGKAA